LISLTTDEVLRTSDLMKVSAFLVALNLLNSYLVTLSTKTSACETLVLFTTATETDVSSPTVETKVYSEVLLNFAT